MELENLKTAWTSVDERLEKKEILSSEMIKEMLKKKSSRSLKKMKIYHFLGLFVGLPLIIYVWYSIVSGLCFSNTILTIAGILVIMCTIILAVALTILFYAFIKYLLKIDFAENVKDNIWLVTKYGILYQKANTVFLCISIPLVLLFVTAGYLTAFYVSIILFVVFAIIVIPVYFLERKFLKKHIQAIKESLEELSELEE